MEGADISQTLFYAGVVVGLALAPLAYRLYRWVFAKPLPAQTAVGEPEEPLSNRLHKLNETIEPFARNAAHTNELATNADFRQAVRLLADAQTPIATVVDYAVGHSWTLSCAGFAALKEREDSGSVVDTVLDRFDNLSAWQMRFALEYLAAAKPRPEAGAPLIGFRDWWIENAPMCHAFADYFAALGEDEPAEVSYEVLALPAATRQQIRTFLDNVRHRLASALAEKLAVTSAAAEPPVSAFLASLGRFWGQESDSGLLVEAKPWRDALGAAHRLVESGAARVLLISGEPYVGKTSFLKLLAERIAPKGWRVFHASGADLQAGQFYIGQLEGRIRDALQELDVGKKIIWYVPDLLALATSGTHQGQSASILDQIMPAISAGRVLIWSEATPAATVRLQQMRPALRRLLEIVRMEEMAEDDALDLAKTMAERLAKASGRAIAPGFYETAVDVAGSYLSAMHLPGSALSLMKLAAQRPEKKSDRAALGAHDVLETLAQQTGLPLSILDGNERLSLEDVRDFFASRVIGQPEAVESIVERIAMLKSGLNDPGKPIGVFLFAGPTGTGKTELAKTVADYLFGSVERMIRLDMSEFQTHEAQAKILGGGGLPADADTLAGRIRKQPFSVVLLDEFEKAHPQIWDLFLQVFDEGRLTDAAGHTVDFRHCLIILTSNLGATMHRDSGIGFKPSQASFTNEQVLKAIGQTFRPEFQNRLDKVIVFKPLTRELMRGILHKELARIFERRGLKDRSWAVEWDASALEFLLEKGFSPEMGARPLKRAIDHYVIAPLAETIVERRFPEGDQFVFVRRDGDGLRADFVDPDGDEEKSPVTPAAKGARTGRPPSLIDMMRAPTGDGEEVAVLAAAEEAIIRRLDAAEWGELKTKLAVEIGAPGFWSRADRAETLIRLELMDRIEVAAETAGSLNSRLTRPGGNQAKSMRDLVSRLAMQIHLVNEGIKDLDEKAPVEAALIIEPVFVPAAEDPDDVKAWCGELLQMYRAWAKKRNMSSSEVDNISGLDGPALIVGGFGAHRALAREAGLHILENGDSGNASERITAQVLVSTLPIGSASKAVIRQSLAASFGKAKRGAVIVRRYRRSPTPLVRSGDGMLRSGKVEDVLRGNFDLFAPEPP